VFGGLAVAAGDFIIKIKNKDGSETELKVPDTATVTVTKDGKELGTFGKETTKKDPTPESRKEPPSKLEVPPRKVEMPTVDSDRAASEAMMAIGGGVLVDGQTRLLRSPAELPVGKFRLTGINLHGNRKVTADAMAPLAGCESIGMAWLNNAAVTDAALAHLPKVAILSLHLHNTLVTDKGLARFDGISTLVELNIGATKATGEGLARFKGCADLTRLWAYFIPLTDDDMAVLDGFKKLTLIQIQGTMVGDDTLARLAKLPNLTELHLEQTKITDDGLVHLRGAKALTFLKIVRTGVTADGVADFAKAMPACKIEWDGGTIAPVK
jgi:hypothetical protein